MRRLVATLACAAAAVSLTSTLTAPAYAQAASKPGAKDPVSALKGQYVSGHGVTITQRTKFHGEIFARTNGIFQFDRSGIRAADVTNKLNVKASDLSDDTKSLATPERTVKIGNTAYLSGGVYSEGLPEGKTWVRMPHGPAAGLFGMFGQPINVAETSTVRYLLAHAAKARPGGTIGGAKTTLYTGTTTHKQLTKVSRWAREMMFLGDKDTAAKTKIYWKLYIGTDQLARRIVSTYSAGTLLSTKLTFSVDTRYTGWGSKVSVKAPPSSEVIDSAALGSGDAGTDDAERVFTGGVDFD